jgi:hypothetical protein
MTETEEETLPRGLISVLPPVILLIIVGIFLYWTLDYTQTARRLPMLIGIGTLLLIMLDIISRLPGRLGIYIRFALGAGFQDREMQFSPNWTSELKQLVWLMGCVISVVLIGILPTVPVFIFFYMFIQGRQGVLPSLLVAVAIMVVVWLVFEYLLEYQLFKGMLFDSDGY